MASIYKSNVGNNKRLALISDSFRIASAPFLAKDFNVSYVCHRSFIPPEIEAGIKELGEGDLLIIMQVERGDYSNCEVVDKIIQILKENYS